MTNRSRWLILGGAAALASGCVTSQLQLVRAEHPPDARIQVEPIRAWAKQEFAWTELALTNRGDADVEVRPDLFAATDERGTSVDFQAWSGFGGSRFTLPTPRPLHPGRRMTGIIRWHAPGRFESLHVRVAFPGEPHLLVFARGGGARSEVLDGPE